MVALPARPAPQTDFTAVAAQATLPPSLEVPMRLTATAAALLVVASLATPVSAMVAAPSPAPASSALHAAAAISPTPVPALSAAPVSADCELGDFEGPCAGYALDFIAEFGLLTLEILLLAVPADKAGKILNLGAEVVDAIKTFRKSAVLTALLSLVPIVQTLDVLASAEHLKNCLQNEELGEGDGGDPGDLPEGGDCLAN